MEKNTPHCKLNLVKTLIETGAVRTTQSARLGATAMGFDFDAMLDVMTALTVADFYKSITSHADHRVWQDVYRPSTPAGAVYVKLTVVDDVLISLLRSCEHDNHENNQMPQLRSG